MSPTRVAQRRLASSSAVVIRAVVGCDATSLRPPLTSVLHHDPLAKCAGWQSHAGRFQAVHEGGANPARFKLTARPPAFVDSFLDVLVDVLHDHRVLLHADHFRDVGHAARSTLQAVGLDDQVARRWRSAAASP